MLVKFFANYFYISAYKMHHRRSVRPLAVHFMLQTNRKSMQKNLQQQLEIQGVKLISKNLIEVLNE